jgi:hypothetical protein
MICSPSSAVCLAFSAARVTRDLRRFLIAGIVSPEISGAPRGTEMGKQVAVVLYVAVMAAVIVGIDFAFFRNRFWERLIVNIGIVLVFAAFYLRFFRNS